MQRILRLILICGLCIASCDKKPPGNLIPEENLVPMLVDFHLAYSIQQSPDFADVISKTDSIDPYSNIFQKHGFSKLEFDTTLSWYTRNPEYLVEVYNDVIMKLSQLSDSINPETF
jgi:hypothetical protein